MESILLSSAYTDGPKARAVPGAFYSSGHKGWVIAQPTPRAAAVALRLFPALANTNPELAELRAKLGQEVRPFDNASGFEGALHCHRVADALWAEGHDFYEYQELDLGYLAAVLRKHGGAYIGWDRGLGKTLAACALADELECRRVLIVSPNTSKRAVWLPELERFCPWLEVIVLRNTKAQREKDLGYVRQLTAAGRPHALVVHYEALDIVAKLRANGRGWDTLGEWDLVVADEAHRIANPKTKMARALKKVPTRYKVALSGSIIQNHAEELFSPLQWLFPKQYKSRWRDWNDRFLDYVESGYGKVCVGIKIDQLENLRRELGVFMVVRYKDDELDLPPKTYQTLRVDLSPGQRKAYTELVEQCFTEMPDGEFVSATGGLALLTRCRQVATGLDLFGDVADSTKLDLAAELIQDSDVPTVVFVWYRAAGVALERRLAKLGIECFRVDGDIKQDDRADCIQRFQAGERQVFIGTLATLGESVTLHRASHVIRIDRAWNPSVNLQAEDRCYRIGQKNAVTVVDIVARGTIDELRVSPVIREKEALRRMVLGG